MTEIIPASIGQNFTEVANKIRLIKAATNLVHLDIMDGTFTDEFSWRAPEALESLEGETKIECHLMVKAPEQILPVWIKVADRIIIHTEATEHLTEIIDSLAGRSVEPALGLNLETPISKIDELIGKVKAVHLMSIAKIGAHGHPFDERVLAKIKHLRSLHPGVIIQVDGGINLTNAQSVIEAGANNLVVGSAIWQTPDPIITLDKFKQLLEASRSF